MNNAKKYLLLALVSIGVLTSCNDYLGFEFDESLDKKEVFSNYTYSLNYVANMYSYLPAGFFSSGGIFEACITDEAKMSEDAPAINAMNNGSFDSRTYIDGGTWGQNYSGIRKVNIFLENVDNAIFLNADNYRKNPELNKELQVTYKAESRFLRAFFYFELLKRFGDPRINLGVPIVPEKSLSLGDELDFARNSYDSCVSYIVSECDTVAKYLSVRCKGANYGHASKAAAMALKSRILLYAASPLANPSNDIEKWKLAAAAAKDIMDLGVYKIIPRTDPKFDRMNVVFTVPDNDEVLFSGQVFQSNNYESLIFPPSYSGFGQVNPSQNLVDAFETLFGFPINDPASKYDPNNPYKQRDGRFGYFIYRNDNVLKSTQIETFVGGKDGINSRRGATKTGYYIRKFADENADIVTFKSPVTHFWVHFRMAEIYLNYAEAMTMAYGPYTLPAGYPLTAHAAIKTLRDRGGIVTPASMLSLTPEQYMERIKNERRVELCFEGHRFWDVRRWKEGEKYLNSPLKGMLITKDAASATGYKFEQIDVENRVFNDKMYVMPIPYDEMQKSKKLVQNTGW